MSKPDPRLPTLEEIAELERIEAEATAPPWAAYERHDDCEYLIATDDRLSLNEESAVFTAALRNAAPGLLALGRLAWKLREAIGDYKPLDPLLAEFDAATEESGEAK